MAGKKNILALALLFVASFVEILQANPLADILPGCLNTLSGSSGTFHSQNYPSNYLNNQKCGWILEAAGNTADIKVTFHDFQLEPSKRCSSYDHVFIYTQTIGSSVWTQMIPFDGYCGTLTIPPKFESCKRMLIKFVSDNDNPFKGFNASYTIKVTQDTPRIQCLGKLGDSKCNQTVHSTEKETLKVACNATAIPPPTFEWFMENSTGSGFFVKIPSTGIKYHAAVNGILTIKDVAMSDAKDYQCKAINKLGTTVAPFSLKVQEKCSCPKSITTNSYDYAPYSRYVKSGDQYGGIFFIILDKMIKDCCGSCSRGHGSSDIIWEKPADLKKKSMSKMKEQLEIGSFDLSFPIEGSKTSEYYSSSHLFIPIVDSPGYALLVKSNNDGQASVIFDSILNGWPILVLTVVMAVLAGMIMWMLDTYWNEEQFPRSFTEGIIEGFWWAFVTMTTVGYGDIAPVGVPGRLFAIMWVLTGLIIISIFTGVITTALTVNSLSTSVNMYGTKVGVLNDSGEFNYAVRKNANVSSYVSAELLSQALYRTNIKAVLLDSYVAAQPPKYFPKTKARVNKIFKTTKAYGFVPGQTLTADDTLIKCFRNYVEQNKQYISTAVENTTQTLEEESTSAAVDNTKGLFDPKSSLFLNAVIISSVLLVVFSILGLLFEYCYLKPKKIMLLAARNLEMVETPEIKEMALRAQKMKEVLLSEIKEFHERWKENVVELRQKHQVQQKDFLKNGPKKDTVPQGNEAFEMDEQSPSPRAGSSVAFVNEKSDKF
ncbi:uncharacterized protein LOC135695552 [Rhopilema esculentum]|uniref:uncharacterized protein LOC135695552 n=1 Tax=Rhopilema esculentum TaxID=499914 RepID=UPI0031D455A2